MSAYGTSSAACVACAVGKVSPAYTAVTSTVPVMRDVTRTCQQGPCFASLWPDSWGSGQGTPAYVDQFYNAQRAVDGSSTTYAHSSNFNAPTGAGAWLRIDFVVRRTIVSGSIMPRPDGLPEYKWNEYCNIFEIWVGDGNVGGADGYKTGNARCFR